jgi:hypothetical protein
MMHINLIRGGSPKVRINAFEVLCKPSYLGTFSPVQSPSLPPSLHPRLMERLLGHAPLRVVLSRTEVKKNIWQEQLECGHQFTAFSEFAVENNRYVQLSITARRRRCRLCKPEVAPILKTKSEITADQARAALIHERKLKFGTMFDALCFGNGEMRPGPTEQELIDLLSYPTRKAVVPMGLHATPGACSRGDADTDSIKGCRFESGETGARTASGGQSTNERTKPENLDDGSSPVISPRKPVQSEKANRKTRLG